METLTNITKTESENMNKKETRIENLLHIQKIAAAMEDPTKWAYNGDMTDSGPGGKSACTCGHPIRYIFWIEREEDGKRLPIGSSCIKTTVPYLIEMGADNLADKLNTAIEEFQEYYNKLLCETAKRKRDHDNNEKLNSITKDLDILVEFVKTERKSYQNSHDGYYVPYPLYRPFQMPKPCAKMGFTVKRYMKAYKEYRNFYNQYRAEYNLSALPEPTSEYLEG